MAGQLQRLRVDARLIRRHAVTQVLAGTELDELLTGYLEQLLSVLAASGFGGGTLHSVSVTPLTTADAQALTLEVRCRNSLTGVPLLVGLLLHVYSEGRRLGQAAVSLVAGQNGESGGYATHTTLLAPLEVARVEAMRDSPKILAQSGLDFNAEVSRVAALVRDHLRANLARRGAWEVDDAIARAVRGIEDALSP